MAGKIAKKGGAKAASGGKRGRKPVPPPRSVVCARSTAVEPTDDSDVSAFTKFRAALLTYMLFVLMEVVLTDPSTVMKVGDSEIDTSTQAAATES